MLVSMVFVLALAPLAATQIAEADHKPSKSECGDERVSVTVNLDGIALEEQLLVLLDTTGSGHLCVVHVAANLPCSDNAPRVNIVAGIAGGDLHPVINDADDNTGFKGPQGTCVFHDTLKAPAKQSITDVIITTTEDFEEVSFLDAIVTITGTYEISQSSDDDDDD